MRTSVQVERNPKAADDTVPARARKTRASPRGEARRREIIAAATRMFSERGFDGATYSELADAVGISQAGLLHHFPTKRELLLAVLRDRDERTRPTASDAKPRARTS